MLKIKGTKITRLLLLAGLMIPAVFLGACDTASDPVKVSFGLRAEAPDTLVEPGPGNVSEIAAPSINDVADTSVELGAETQSGVVSAGVTVSNQLSRTADRSQHIFDPATAVEPTTAEIEGLIFMREEEKLARDVYLALYDQWGMPVFQNIAGSEQAHMDSILMLLDQYELTDPAAGKEVGKFANPLFQSLYEQLVEQGRLSQADALIVGATIEELDIIDLEERLAQAGNEYIIQVYTNLLAGSENHLRAFVSNLQRLTGEDHQPIYLDQDAYQAILNGAPERGGGYGGGNERGGNGGNGNGRRNGQGGNV